MEKKRKNTKQANRKVYDKRQELIAFYESQGGKINYLKLFYFF